MPTRRTAGSSSRSLALVLPAIVGCTTIVYQTEGGDSGSDSAAADSSGGSDPTAGSDGGGSTGVGDTTGSATDGESGGPVGDGLPCDIDAFLQQRCRTCHGGAPAVSATLLLNHDDLLADSISQPGTSVGVVAVSRLADGATLPMPPLPATPVPGEERDLFDAWVADGMPTGDCVPDPPEPDPFDVDPICTSDRWWTQGMFEGGDHMDPGRACIACHADPTAFGGEPHEAEGENLFAVSGTIFPTAHEPDDCYGIDGTVATDTRIEITTQDGPTVVLPINAAGNFFLAVQDAPTGLEPPFLVKVVTADAEWPMAAPAPHGDCNVCHTQNGELDVIGTDDSLGRIIPP